VLTAVTSVSEVILILLQLNSFANPAAFFWPLLGVYYHTHFEQATAVRKLVATTLLKKINSLLDSWLVLRKQWFTNRFFMPIELSYIVLFMPVGTIVDRFVIFVFLRNNTIRRINGVQEFWGLEVCNGFGGFRGAESKNRIRFCPSGHG